MGHLIEEAISEDSAKVMENITITKIQVFLKEYGRKECLVEKANTYNPEVKYINVYGQMERFQLFLINDIFCF